MIYFVRHGQSTANAGGVTMAHAEIPLSDLGRRQAALVATLLDVEPTLILSSTYVRALDTARPFSDKTGCPITPHPLLHEFSALDAGLIEGMVTAQRRPMADAFWNAADPDLRHGPGSETFLEFEARVAAFRGELEHLPDNTVLFGHGIWFGLLSWKLLGFRADDAVGMREFRRFQSGLPMPNCTVYALEPGAPGKWCLQAREELMRKMATADGAALNGPSSFRVERDSQNL